MSSPDPMEQMDPELQHFVDLADWLIQQEELANGNIGNLGAMAQQNLGLLLDVLAQAVPNEDCLEVPHRHLEIVHGTVAHRVTGVLRDVSFYSLYGYPD